MTTYFDINRLDFKKILKYEVKPREAKAIGYWPAVYVERRVQRDGSIFWCVTCDGEFVLNKRTRYWEDEPQPSSRTAAFISRTRFDTFEAAFEAAQKAEMP